MEVILLERVANLGSLGDLVKVKNGYARNYLLPRNKCLLATQKNKEFFDQKKEEIQKDLAEKSKDASSISSLIEEKFYILIRTAGEDGRLYGSVNTRDIANEVSTDKIKIDKNQISLDDAIKYLGVYPVKVSLHSEVETKVYVNVARSATEAVEAEKEFLNPTVEEPEEIHAEAYIAEAYEAEIAEAVEGQEAEEVK